MVALTAVSSAAEPAKLLVDRVLALLEKVDYRRIETPEDRDAVFRLRYDAYLREGAIPPNSERRFSDALDDTRNAIIFGVYVDGDLASSIRLHVATRSQPELPAMGVFSDLLGPEINAGKVIIDPTRFVIDREASRQLPELAYVTTRLGWLAGEAFGANLILATVRAEHRAFYRRVYGHRLICDPRHYPSLDKPICLMALDYPMSRERVPARYPFLRSTLFERRMLFGQTVRVAGLRDAA